MNPPLLALSLLLTCAAAAAAEPIKVPETGPRTPAGSGPAPRKTPVLCTIPKTDSDGTFYVVAAPDVTCPKSIEVNEPVYAILECVTGRNSATCEAWPRVYAVNPGDEDRLHYGWSVRVGWVTTHYPQSSSPTLSFACPGIQPVSVTVSVSNGTAVDYDFTGFRCGDDPR